MASSTRQPTIILVDGDAAVRGSLKFSLEMDGYKVEVHESGEALAAQRDFPENGCLVIDQALPGMTGLQLIRTLRARAVKLPAVLITSQPNRALRAEAAAAGVPIVEKPLLSDALVTSVQHAFLEQTSGA